MRKLLFGICAIGAVAAPACGNDISFVLSSQGYGQDSAVATDLFKNQGLLLSGGVVTACGGDCLTAPAYSYDGWLTGTFVHDGTTDATTVHNLTFFGITGNVQIWLYDASNNLIGAPTSIGYTADANYYGNEEPTYVYNGPVGVASFQANFGYDAFRTLSFDSGAVPEPASWALMLGGFGLVGGVMRRRRTAVRFA